MIIISNIISNVISNVNQYYNQLCKYLRQPVFVLTPYKYVRNREAGQTYFKSG